MPDSSLVTSLGVPGLSIGILWMAYKAFMQAMERKDADHAKERAEQAAHHRTEREELIKRLDARDDSFRKLEADVRNLFAATIVESGNVIKQAVIHLAKRSKHKV